MSGGGQQGQQGQGGLEAGYYSAGLVIFIALLWIFYKSTIITIVFGFERHQAYAFIFIVGFLELLITEMIPIQFQHYFLKYVDTTSLKNAVAIMDNNLPENVDVVMFISVVYTVGFYFAVVTSPILIGLGSYLMFTATATKFKIIYNMEKLRQYESSNWPFITTVLGTKLHKTGLDEGDFAMSLQPMAFAKKHKLLDVKEVAGKTVASVNRARAHKVFTLQMGPQWRGNLQDYPPYILALFAVFCAKGEHDPKSAEFLLRQISESSRNGNKKLDYSGSHRILAKHIQSVNVARVVSPHAYLYTALAALLEFARGDGVIATAEFLWLKTIDRELWYVLNSVGRQVAFAEVAGPIGHYKVEKRLRRPLKTPVIEEAINALEESVSEIIYKED
ncbi:MAG: type IVB secretion system coupling complex protein DotM/IcmP [Pseudomonadota bacterium]|nr:type IVB secretion system coupling complex protein DotM/IcmP [Pseudomonadota bacterium]